MAVGRLAVVAAAWLAATSTVAQQYPTASSAPVPSRSGPTATRSYSFPSAILDLSSHNTIPIDATLKSRHGIGMVIHRATLGIDTGGPNDVDAMFPDRALQITRAGLRLGAYHWATPTGPGDRQADDFLRVVKAACDLMPPAMRRVVLALDWEPHGNNPDHYMRAAEVDRFLRRAMARTGRSVLVYAYENFIHEQRGAIAATPGLWKLLARNPLWIANYRVNTDGNGYALRGGVILPRVAGSPWSSWSLWQYTSGDNGPIADFPPGKIAGQPVDRNVFNGTRADFERFANAQSWDCKYRVR